MILTQIAPINFGPFASPTLLKVEPNVTVLTGSNDTGKTSLMRAIHLVCSNEAMLEGELNRDRINQFKGAWTDDPDIHAVASFAVTEATFRGKLIRGEPQLGDVLTIKKRLNQANGAYDIIDLSRQGKPVSHSVSMRRGPRTLWMPPRDEIREMVKIANPNSAESMFLKLGFGESFTVEHFNSLNPGNRVYVIDEAQSKLNDRLKQIVPSNMPLRFRICESREQTGELAVSLIDAHRGHTPVGCRGAGVRRIVALMGAVLLMDSMEEHAIILFDEPETSLHADAQHMLRRILEGLAERPNIQVVYSTHSPAMINTMRPTSIRVLERRRVGDKPSSVVNNQAFDNNYYRVRSSLGITPADSLLYSPVTVILEGATEVRCLAAVLEKLRKAGITGFENVHKSLEQAHFLDGNGDAIEFMCRISKSQSISPIILLDGDKPQSLAKLTAAHPDVPIIVFPANQEFEDIVPLDNYIAAVRDALKGLEGANRERYDEWIEARKFKPSLVISKRVERWIGSFRDYCG